MIPRRPQKRNYGHPFYHVECELNLVERRISREQENTGILGSHVHWINQHPTSDFMCVKYGSLPQ